MKNFVEELKWRGMLHDIMPGTEEYLLKNQTTAYVGFDPTAASLTIGNLVTIMMLVHFQHAGHTPMALVGGATGMIGDPSGKSEERNFLSEETLRLNQEGIRNQLTKFLNFDCGATSAKLVNNYDWFKGIGFLEFLRDAGKNLTVNYMMSKDSVKSRMDSGTGISYTEFSYQLLQGYDYYHLYKNENVRLQMGGSDQWGNITSGTTLIKKMAEGTAFALTTPLLTKADGTKFGKSAGGNIWLDPNLTSPYKFYQFWLNSADEDVSRFIRIFTLLSKEEIETLEAEHAKAPHERLLQKTLAKDITIRVHSEEEYEMAIKASEILFGKSVTEDLQALKEDTLLAVLEGVPMVEISKSILAEKPTVLELLSTHSNAEIFPSKGEARKMIQGGGVSINKIKINSSEEIVNYPLLLDSYLLVQKGRRNYYLLRFN